MPSAPSPSKVTIGAYGRQDLGSLTPVLGEFGGIRTAEERFDGEDRLDRSALADVSGLVDREAGVKRNQRSPRQLDTQHGGGEVGAVRAPRCRRGRPSALRWLRVMQRSPRTDRCTRERSSADRRPPSQEDRRRPLRPNARRRRWSRRPAQGSRGSAPRRSSGESRQSRGFARRDDGSADGARELGRASEERREEQRAANEPGQGEFLRETHASAHLQTVAHGGVQRGCGEGLGGQDGDGVGSPSQLSAVRAAAPPSATSMSVRRCWTAW